MAKYMVMVNQKYMVQVEHDGSACGAEHVILDEFADAINAFGIITACQAFDRHDMRTNSYLDWFQSCECISMAELARKVREVIDAYEHHNELSQKAADQMALVNDLQRQLHLANTVLNEIERNVSISREDLKAITAEF